MISLCISFHVYNCYNENDLRPFFALKKGFFLFKNIINNGLNQMIFFHSLVIMPKTR